MNQECRNHLENWNHEFRHMNTRNYIQQVHVQESFMELQSYINSLLMGKLVIYQ